MKAVLIGSIGALTETSEIQRQCFNQALREFDTNLHWNIASYCELLRTPGGLARLSAHGIRDDIARKIHERKQDLFASAIQGQITAREGMIDLIDQCHEQEIALGFVTTTTQTTLNAIITALSDQIAFDRFAVITTADAVTRAKPHSDIYHYALSKLGLTAQDAIAIEDSYANVRAAEGAGLSCLFTPGDYALVPRFDSVSQTVSYGACLSQMQKAA